jgi:hypothetical protein
MRGLVPPGACQLAFAGGMAALAASPVATPIGVGPAFHPAPLGWEAGRGLPVAGLECEVRETPRVGAHLELFANGRAVIVPAGIGVAPPRRERGPYVVSGRCSYAARTREPTGVIELARERGVTLGAFFRVWGQALGPGRLGGFRGRVRVYASGRRRHVDPRAVVLRRHDQIVLEVGAFVPPHASYRFRKGL